MNKETQASQILINATLFELDSEALAVFSRLVSEHEELFHKQAKREGVGIVGLAFAQAMINIDNDADNAASKK